MRQIFYFLGIGSLFLTADTLLAQTPTPVPTLINKQEKPGTIEPQLNQSPPQLQDSKQPIPQGDSNGYVINFTNVGIIEYIRFISHISNTNFVFQENDLQFNVTIVSEGPTSVEDIMSALLQILQIHGMSLVEQGNNVLIYKTQDVTKLATVVEGDSNMYSPLVTRVIRVTYANPNKLKNIITPMLSQKAVVEVSPETRHIIVTDITGNIEKAAANMPGIVEQRFNQLQEIDAILEYLNIELRRLRSQHFRKYLENYQRALSSRDCEKYVEGEADVVDFEKIINEFALLRNKWLGITKALDVKQWQLSNVIKLRTAGMEDASL